MTDPDEKAAKQKTAAALNQAIAGVDSPEKAERVISELERSAEGVTAHEVAKETPEPSCAEDAAESIQDVAQDTGSQKPEAVIEKAAAEIAAASPEDRKVLAEGVAQATNPAAAAVEQPQLAPQRQLLRQALMHRLAPFDRVDVAIFLGVNSLPHPDVLNAFMYGLSAAMTRGDALALALLIEAIRDRRRGRQAFLDVVPALLLTSITVEGPVKHYFRRHRPFISLVRAIVVGKKPGGYSFPSGHSASSFAGALLMQRYHPRLAPLYYTLAGMVAFSRVYLGVHYPGDVFTGALSGLLLATGYRRVVERLLNSLD